MLFKLPDSLQPSSARPQWREDGAVSLPVLLLPARTPADMPIPNCPNVLVTGVIGTGKSVFTRACTRAIMKAKPDLKTVFFQVKPDDYTAPFLTARDKVITYSTRAAHPGQHFKWGIVREIRQAADAEAELRQISSSLFEPLMKDGDGVVWASTARDVFESYIRSIVCTTKACPPNGDIVTSLSRATVDQIRDYIARSPDNAAVVRDVFLANDTFRNDVMSFLRTAVSSFGTDNNFVSADGQDTISDFLRDSRAGNLFILHDLAHEEVAKGWEAYFLKKIINDKLSASSGVRAPVLLVCDEIDKVGVDVGLTKAVTLGRESRLNCIVSTQSLENLYAIAPPKNREMSTKAMLAGFPNIVSFRCGSPDTLKTLQALFGSELRWETALSASRYAPAVTQLSTEPIVRDEEFASLDVGEFYAKLGPARPVKAKLVL